MKKQYFLLLVILLITVINAGAQSEIIPLYNGAIPGAIQNKDYTEKETFKDGELQSTSNVTTPTLAIYRPAENKANGTAVLILPGGGYGHLSMFKEGKKVAKWLNSLGVTAFVLKYRLPADVIMKNKTTGPLQDAQEAMKAIRRNAVLWKINPAKIGVIGFSAGGHLAATLSTHFNGNLLPAQDRASSRPDFSLLIYPVISMQNEITHKGSQRNLLGENPSEELVYKFSAELHTNPNTPPAFLVHSADDKSVPVENSINYFLALKKNGVAAELHVYEKGGHGFGLSSEDRSEYWASSCSKWLKLQGFLPQ